MKSEKRNTEMREFLSVCFVENLYPNGIISA